MSWCKRDNSITNALPGIMPFFALTITHQIYLIPFFSPAYCITVKWGQLVGPPGFGHALHCFISLWMLASVGLNICAFRESSHGCIGYVCIIEKLIWHAIDHSISWKNKCMNCNSIEWQFKKASQKHKPLLVAIELSYCCFGGHCVDSWGWLGWSAADAQVASLHTYWFPHPLPRATDCGINLQVHPRR